MGAYPPGPMVNRPGGDHRHLEIMGRQRHDAGPRPRRSLPKPLITLVP